MNDSLKQALSKYQASDKPVSNAILIIGQSGSGKTSSAENLPLESTAIFNIENKPLPFKKKFTNVFSFPQDTPHTTMLELMAQVGRDPSIEYLFIDSFTAYWEMLYEHCRKVKTGFEIFNLFNNEIYRFLSVIKSLPTPFVILTARDELLPIALPDGSTVTRQRCAVMGKDWEKRQIESQFTYVLFMETRRQVTGTTLSYNFVTNSNGYNSAKTPVKYGFQQIIPNDIAAFCSKIREIDYK